jgi:acyl-CoA synthetase (NDP forming)/uncharacterized OB-fold protein
MNKPIPTAEGDWTQGNASIQFDRCSACGVKTYFHRDFCPKCGSRNIEKETAGPYGVVYATSLVFRAPMPEWKSVAPYMLALVDLDDGIRVMSHGEKTLAIGDRVVLGFPTIANRVVPFATKLDLETESNTTMNSQTSMSQQGVRDLASATNPQSIAIVGASENENKLGGRCLQYLLRFGYKGKIFPINPTREETQGLRTYPDISSLPEPAELVVIAVPGAQAVEAVETAAKHGTKVAVVLTAGFGETNDAGREQERKMVDIGRKYGIRIVGPNTQGLANFSNGAIANFSTMFIETTPADGPVAIISQSGGGSAVPFGLLRERNIGVRYCHAIGNQCDVTVSELAINAARDPEVKILLLYLEGIPDANHIAELGAIARERRLPVLVLKSGRTAAGQKASLSHTGSLATEDKVVDAFLSFHGLHRVSGIDDLVRAVELYLKDWKPTGRKLVVVSNSGTACVLAADAATTAGLSIEELLPQTRAKLSEVLPGFASTVNPVDITAALLSNSRLFGDILPIIADDPRADAFIISVPVAGRGYDVEAFARDAGEFAARTGKPVVMISPQPKVASRFRAQGLPVFTIESEGVHALAQFTSTYETLDRATKARKDTTIRAIAKVDRSKKSKVLNEADSLALMQRHAIPVAEHRLCQTDDEVLVAIRELGGKVAIKGCSDKVTHKSDIGLVVIGVASDDEAVKACGQIRQSAAKNQIDLDGILVSRMIAGRRELIVGAHLDPTFGPVLTVGDGGKYVEQMPDVQIVMAGASREEIKEAISRLRIAAVLAGVRGEAPMDVESLSDMLISVGKLMLESDVASIDLNPVMMLDAGKGCCAVDSVVITLE